MARSELELGILQEASRILGSSLELEELFGQVMRLLQQRLNVRHATLVRRDESHERLHIAAAIGLSEAEQARGWYDIGEGMTGQVVATGQPRVVPDVAAEPDFLDRTGVMASSDGDQPMSFVCVPITWEQQIDGAISVAKPFEDDATLAADARLISILAANIALAIRINQMVQLEKDQWRQQTEQLQENLRGKFRFENIIGSSAAMMEVFATIGIVASSRATCLLLGETGTGKELIAKAIHYNSPRRDGPFIRVNCGALSETLLESELFGHVKGSFTGALRDKIGRFEAADGGSLFLDEIGTLDPQLQIKLLRVLQEREFERVGDHHTIKVDVRVIAATNLDLEQEVQRNRFREDLYYRLNVVTIHLPPLRNRREDVPRLIDHFLDKYNDENGRNLRKINRELMSALQRYPWPGNVRELENAIERAVVLSQSDTFVDELLPMQIRMFMHQGRGNAEAETIESLSRKLAGQAVEEYELREGEVYDLVINEIERQLITRSLERHGNVKTKSADFLGINRNTLNKKVKELGIE